MIELTTSRKRLKVDKSNLVKRKKEKRIRVWVAALTRLKNSET
jgi:hypothetical protein